MKLHVGCGDVYLKGYVNCDVDGWAAPQEGNINETTVEQYFKFPFGSPRRPIYVDRMFNALDRWPFENGSVEEVITISFLEHFSNLDARHIVQEVERILMPGGRWVVDFPDIKATVDQYYDTDPEFCMRLVYCNHKNQYSVHHWGYTPRTFAAMLDSTKWMSIRPETVIQHDYPMIGMVATRS